MLLREIRDETIYMKVFKTVFSLHPLHYAYRHVPYLYLANVNINLDYFWDFSVLLSSFSMF